MMLWCRTYDGKLDEQSHGLEIVPSYSQRPTSPVQQLQTGRPSWDFGVSSPHYGGSRDPDVHLASSNEQE